MRSDDEAPVTPPGPPLIDEVLRSADPGAAEQILRRVYPVARLHESRGRFWFEQTMRGEPDVVFARFKFSSWIDVAVEFENIAGFGVLLGGRYDAQSRGRRLDTSRPFLYVPGDGRAEAEGLDALMVNIDLRRLERASAQRLGVDRVSIDFRGNAPVSETMATHWTRIVGYAWRNVMQVDEVFRNDLIRASTFDAVVASALSVFPIHVIEGPVPNGSGVRSSAIRRAQAFIEENLDRPLTVEQIAAAARLSVRALQSGFRRELDTTPLTYLRRVRLFQVRSELLDADPGIQLVADIARRWGFVNLGRFAADYRELFGENPAATLRR